MYVIYYNQNEGSKDSKKMIRYLLKINKKGMI